MLIKTMLDNAHDVAGFTPLENVQPLWAGSAANEAGEVDYALERRQRRQRRQARALSRPTGGWTVRMW